MALNAVGSKLGFVDLRRSANDNGYFYDVPVIL